MFGFRPSATLTSRSVALETLATGKQINDDEDDGHDNENMEKAADRGARNHAEQPQHQQNYRNSI